MPTASQSAARECSHPRYPEYQERFGEDPARILYHFDPRPRIDAIQSRDLARAYLDVETDRDEPRREVVACLNQRLDELENRGGDE